MNILLPFINFSAINHDLMIHENVNKNYFRIKEKNQLKKDDDTASEETKEFKKGHLVRRKGKNKAQCY